MKVKILLPLLLVLFSGINSASSTPRDQNEIQTILEQAEPPEGVVFEIIADENGLEWAIPRIQDYSQKLRKKFPQLSIAVVTHGREQFALKSSEQLVYSDVHQQVQSLVKDEQIPVHVCGTFAEWRGVTPEEFPDYIDVAAEGPAQIRNYEELGYILVELEAPDD